MLWFFLTTNAFAQTNNVISIGGEELIVEMQETSELGDYKLLKFQIPSNDYVKLCPPNQCEIEITSIFTGAPSANFDSSMINAIIHFYLHDDITNANLIPAQKSFIEHFLFSVGCYISDINQIVRHQDSDQVLYNCDDDGKSGAYLAPMESSSTLPSLYYSYKVTYDTESEIMQLNGKFVNIIFIYFL